MKVRLAAISQAYQQSVAKKADSTYGTSQKTGLYLYLVVVYDVLEGSFSMTETIAPDKCEKPMHRADLLQSADMAFVQTMLEDLRIKRVHLSAPLFTYVGGSLFDCLRYRGGFSLLLPQIPGGFSLLLPQIPGGFSL